MYESTVFPNLVLLVANSERNFDFSPQLFEMNDISDCKLVLGKQNKLTENNFVIFLRFDEKVIIV